MKKRLLFISTIFPNKFAKMHATFTLQGLRALQAYFDIDVINPLPWHFKIKNRIPYQYSLEGMSVTHPTYWYPPGILRSYYGLFYYLSIRLSAESLIKARKPDIILSSWLYPDGWAASKIAELYNIPAIGKAIGTDANRLVEGNALAAKTVNTIARLKRVECVSVALMNKLISIGADPSKLFVLYNGVDRDIFRKMDKSMIRDNLGYSIRDILILFVGNLLQTKGLDELAKSFQTVRKCNEFRNAKMIIAGTGKYEPYFKNKLKLAGVSSDVIFMGSCTLPVVAKLMNASDVVCLPSYNEGLPNVVLEALCCNAKVVATVVGGIPELAPLHKNLYLVPPKNTEALSSVLVKAIKADCAVDPAEDIGSWAEYASKLSEYL